MMSFAILGGGCPYALRFPACLKFYPSSLRKDIFFLVLMRDDSGFDFDIGLLYVFLIIYII